MKKVSLLLLLLAAWCGTASAQNITTVAGCGIGDDSLATKAELTGPVCVTMDKVGNTYIAESGSYRIRRVSPAGIITTFAGTGNFGASGDGGPATAADIGVVYGMAFDKHGNFVFSDIANNIIRRIAPSGTITTIGGLGSGGYSGDGGPATAAEFYQPTDIVIDTNDNIFIADFYNNVVRKINAGGIVSTVVGDGSTGTTGNGGPATAAELGTPFRLALDNKGNLYVAEVIFQCICKVDTAGILTIIADTTGGYNIGPDGDGGLAVDALMTSPCGLAVDTSGHLWFSDIGNERIRMIDLNTGIINNYAASGTAGYGGDGGPATAAMISTPEGLYWDPAGHLLISDADNNRIRRVSTTTGTMTTLAGMNGLFGEGYPGTNAQISSPYNVATDAAGNLYFADYNNNRVRKLDVSTGTIVTVAGTGVAGYGNVFGGDGGPATASMVYNPTAIAVSNTGELYICDAGNQRIRKVSTSGIITTIAGTGTYGSSGDGGPATAAKLNGPAGIAIDTLGNVYIADQGNNRIRRINTAGVIRTVAGTGVAGFSGDGGPATAAKLGYASDVALDGIGNIYIADVYNNRVRRIDTNGIISTFAGTGTGASTGDGSPAYMAAVNLPAGIKADKAGYVYIAESGGNRVRIVTPSGIINTYAGNGTAGFSGDGGPATAAKINGPAGVAVDAAGNMYIADAGNNRIRRTTLPWVAVPNTGSALAAVAVYPNPAISTVTISNATGCILCVYDAAGREISRTNITGAQQHVDVSGLAPGIYMLQAISPDGAKRSFRIVKG